MIHVGTRPEPATEPDDSNAVTIPSLVQLGRRAIPQVLEGAVLPLCAFWLVLHFEGMTPAIVVGLACSAATIGYRILSNRRVHGMLIVGALALLARSVVALMTGSAFLYFVQPIVGTVLISLAFLLSVRIGRPLARRFASDYCMIPPRLLRERRVHAYFQRCSLMWAGVGFANAAITLWLLASQSTSTYLVAKTTLTITVNVAAVAASVLWFRHTVTRHDLAVVRSPELGAGGTI